MASSQVIVETKLASTHTHTPTHTHTHAPGLQINTFKNSSCAFEWKSSIHMAVHAHTYTQSDVYIFPRESGVQRELTKRKTADRQ